MENVNKQQDSTGQRYVAGNLGGARNPVEWVQVPPGREFAREYAKPNVKPKPVEMELQRLQKSVEELAASVKGHVDTLAPVLLPDPLLAKGGGVVSEQEDSGPLGNQIRSVTEQVNSLSSLMSSIRFRITI